MESWVRVYEQLSGCHGDYCARVNDGNARRFRLELMWCGREYGRENDDRRG